MNSRRTGILVSVSFVLTCASAYAQDTIVEAGSGGQNNANYAEISGQWSNGADPQSERSSAPGLSAPDKCPSRKITPGVSSEARFYPRFTQTGHYCVYATWAKSANAKQVLYMTKS